ncbi:MAG: DUF3307 domain-containing protein [Firmicutes bacterium]|nr:DUF3307 domain-containing protein [Bacillota bacterium]
MFTLIMLISHTMSDFILQTDKTVKLKSQMCYNGYLSHMISLLFTSFPICFFIELSLVKDVFLKIVIIIAIHIILDIVKETMQTYFKQNDLLPEKNLLTFLVDQIVHLLMIMFITRDTLLVVNTFGKFILNNFFSDSVLMYIDIKEIFIILYVSFSGMYFIPLVFDIIYKKVENYTGIINRILKNGGEYDTYSFIDEVNTGKWIGVLERILILIFLYSNQLSAIGFIIAAKSLARFKMMENKIFSEYYLIGTLLSLVYAFFGFGIFQKIL